MPHAVGPITLAVDAVDEPRSHGTFSGEGGPPLAYYWSCASQAEKLQFLDGLSKFNHSYCLQRVKHACSFGECPWRARHTVPVEVPYGGITDKIEPPLQHRLQQMCRGGGLSGKNCNYFRHYCLELGRERFARFWCTVVIWAKFSGNYSVLSKVRLIGE